MVKVWITGASGHVGRELTRMLNAMDYEIFPTDIEEVDVTDADAVNQYMQISRPDVVINCAAYHVPEDGSVDSDMAYKVNALGARNLAYACQAYSGKLIHLSTDDVFGGNKQLDGRSEAFTEFDMPHPATVYGKSKLAGEELVRSLCTRYVIIRSSWMYGIGRDYMNQVIKTYRSGETIKAPRNQIASPTSATAVARAVAYFIDNEKYGTYHVSCNGSATRYEFALEILKNLGVDGFDEKVVPVGEAEGFGEEFTLLDNLMLRIDGIGNMKDWKEVLAEYIKEHPEVANGK